jgi:hypothetical protein
MKYILLLFLYIILINNVLAQQKDTIHTVNLNEKARYVGINITPLVTQFIPLNRTNPRISGPYNFIYKRFNEKGSAFVVAAGVDVLEFGASESNFHLNIRLGWEERRAFYYNWQYAFGASALWTMGNFNTPGATSNGSDLSIGIAPTFSVGYALNETISMGTETMLYIGFINESNEGINISFVPPVAIYLNFKLTNKPKKSRK